MKTIKILQYDLALENSRGFICPIYKNFTDPVKLNVNCLYHLALQTFLSHL